MNKIKPFIASSLMNNTIGGDDKKKKRKPITTDNSRRGGGEGGKEESAKNIEKSSTGGVDDKCGRGGVGGMSRGGRTSCCQFQQIVSQFFGDHSRLVAKWPLPFLLIPVMTTIGLSTSIILYPDRLEERPSENRLSMFLPENVPAMDHLTQLKDLFPPRDIVRDSYDVFKSAFAFVILEDSSPAGNVLRDPVLRIAGNLDRRIKRLEARIGWITANFSQICHKLDGDCMEHPILVMLNGTSSPMSSIKYFLKYPYFKIGNQTIRNSPLFGSVTLDNVGNIASAKALRIPYLIDDKGPLELKVLAYLWQKEFLKMMKTADYSGVKIYYSTAISWAEEIDRNGKMILPYIPVLFSVLVLFSVCSCVTNDWVLSKPWLGICGILNGCFAVASTLGTLVFLEYPFLQMVFIMPFLILSISVDNMFLMLSAWRNTEAGGLVEDRMSSAMGDTAVSIMITALTDGLSFSVGSISQFPAVRIFCTYCALAVLFVFLYQMTFFTACMALTGRREAANRHAFTCSRAMSKEAAEGRSIWYRLFCTGGNQNSDGRTTTRSQRPRTIPMSNSNNQYEDINEDGQILSKFLSGPYANIINLKAVKALVMILYLAYLAASIYGLMQLPLGLELPLLVPKDSYAALEFRATERHFTEFGAYAYAVIHSPNEELPYHNLESSATECVYSRKDFRESQLRLYYALTNTDYTTRGQFWLRDFYIATNRMNFGSNAGFVKRLRIFLAEPENHAYKDDILFHPNRSSHIVASKMLIQTRFAGFTNHTRMAGRLRSIFDKSGFNGFVYDPSFLLVDQQDATLMNVLQNMGIAVLVMLLIAFLFIPKLISCLWIGISIISINLGVVGGLAIWSVHLDIVSMITIVMSVGFSVDFVAHITFHFLVSQGKHRLNKAMKYVGLPIMQSGLSTVLGVSTLIPAGSYMVRTFVKTVVLVVGLGTAHGLLFLPVILSIFVPENTYLETFESYKSKVGHYLATNIPKYLSDIRNKRMEIYKTGMSKIGVGTARRGRRSSKMDDSFTNKVMETVSMDSGDSWNDNIIDNHHRRGGEAAYGIAQIPQHHFRQHLQHHSSPPPPPPIGDNNNFPRKSVRRRNYNNPSEEIINMSDVEDEDKEDVIYNDGGDGDDGDPVYNDGELENPYLHDGNLRRSHHEYHSKRGGNIVVGAAAAASKQRIPPPLPSKPPGKHRLNSLISSTSGGVGTNKNQNHRHSQRDLAPPFIDGNNRHRQSERIRQGGSDKHHRSRSAHNQQSARLKNALNSNRQSNHRRHQHPQQQLGSDIHNLSASSRNNNTDNNRKSARHKHINNQQHSNLPPRPATSSTTVTTTTANTTDGGGDSSNAHRRHHDYYQHRSGGKPRPHKNSVNHDGKRSSTNHNNHHTPPESGGGGGEGRSSSLNSLYDFLKHKSRKNTIAFTSDETTAGDDENDIYSEVVDHGHGCCDHHHGGDESCATSCSSPIHFHHHNHPATTSGPSDLLYDDEDDESPPPPPMSDSVTDSDAPLVFSRSRQNHFSIHNFRGAAGGAGGGRGGGNISSSSAISTEGFHNHRGVNFRSQRAYSPPSWQRDSQRMYTKRGDRHRQSDRYYDSRRRTTNDSGGNRKRNSGGGDHRGWRHHHPPPHQMMTPSSDSSTNVPSKGDFPPPPRETLANIMMDHHIKSRDDGMKRSDHHDHHRLIVPPQSETVQIVLRGALGSRSQLQRSVSAEHLSQQSAAGGVGVDGSTSADDSDEFNNIQHQHHRRQYSVQYHEHPPGGVDGVHGDENHPAAVGAGAGAIKPTTSLPDFSTFKGKSTVAHDVMRNGFFADNGGGGGGGGSSRHHQQPARSNNQHPPESEEMILDDDHIHKQMMY